MSSGKGKERIRDAFTINSPYLETIHYVYVNIHTYVCENSFLLCFFVFCFLVYGHCSVSCVSFFKNVYKISFKCLKWLRKQYLKHLHLSLKKWRHHQLKVQQFPINNTFKFPLVFFLKQKCLLSLCSQSHLSGKVIKLSKNQ